MTTADVLRRIPDAAAAASSAAAPATKRLFRSSHFKTHSAHDKTLLASLLKLPFVQTNPTLKKEAEAMQRHGKKVNLEAFHRLGPDMLKNFTVDKVKAHASAAGVVL